MRHTTTETQIEATPLTLQALDEIVREGARSLLQAALQAEVQEHLARYQNVMTRCGPRFRQCCARCLGERCQVSVPDIFPRLMLAEVYV